MTRGPRVARRERVGAKQGLCRGRATGREGAGRAEGGEVVDSEKGRVDRDTSRRWRTGIPNPVRGAGTCLGGTHNPEHRESDLD